MLSTVNERLPISPRSHYFSSATILPICDTLNEILVTKHHNCDLENSFSYELSEPDQSSDETNKVQHKKQIVNHKRLQLTPTLFANGCICGHHVEYRDTFCETRKKRNLKPLGVTIRPKTSPIVVSFRV